jgi:cyclase
MENYRRWAIGLLMALFTLMGVVGLQNQTPAQMSVGASLETAGLTLEELADGVYGLIASTDFPPSSEAAAICNGGIVIGSDGVLVVDPFQSEELANLLFSTVESLTDQPIRYVLNTHYHFDHTGGNAAAAALEFPLVGRGPIRDFMLTRNLEMDPNVTPPDVIVNATGDLWLGDRQVRLIEFDGHSGGTDLVAYLPDGDVLLAGDLLFTERFPYMADGNIRSWQATLEQLATDYSTATILPGHGPVSDRTDLTALNRYLEELVTLATAWKAAGLSEEEAIAQTELPDNYANYLFQGLFPSNLATAYQQITLGEDDAASIQAYFQAQAADLQAL